MAQRSHGPPSGRQQPQHPAASPPARQAPALAAQVQPRTQLSTRPGEVPLQPVAPLQVNLQEQLQQMFADPTQAPILLCLGQKGGGKSFRTMTLLMWLLRNNVFDQYFLVLPTFHFEASNSYAWLQPFEDRVFISKEYTPEMSLAFLQRPDETIPPHAIPRTFLWLDDVGMNEAFRTDRHFVGLLSVARHKRLSVCLCYHSLTSGHTLSPFLRQNITHTLLFRVTNEKLLESIYEELISMTGHFERFREFKRLYNQHTCSQVNPTTGEVEKNFNGICINNAVGCLDWNVSEWFPEETEVLKTFLESMREEMEARNLPPPSKHQHLKEIEPKMVANVKGASPAVSASVGAGASASNPQRMELTPESWNHLKQAAAGDAMVFLTHPRNLVKYQKVALQKHVPNFPR